MFNTTPEHLIKAKEMAEAIYKEAPEKHPEMLKVIKTTLCDLHTKTLEILNKV